LLVSICSAQQTATTSVPNLIRYSGTLKDAQGAALSSSTAVGVTFSIYKQQDGGASVWMETQNVTPDSSGQYNVILGSTTTTGLPDDLFSQQEQRWLGVQVQGQDEQARVLLVSVPYAFKAHEADTLGGLPASAFVQAAPSDASGSGSSVAGTAVNALGGVASAGSAPNGNGGSGKFPTRPCTVIPGYITYWDSTGALCASQLIQLGNGNVGIGTKVPSTKLEVGGAITADLWYDITTAESPFLSIGWPGPPNPDNQNTWLGLQAGGQGILTTDTGTMNTFTGYTAGFGNTTGYQNSCYGNAACLHNLTGIENVAVGAGAGFRNTDGNSNVYVGFDAAWGSFIGSHGSNNTITGWESGFNNSASNNVFYGYKSGFANTTATQNTFLGYQAGVANKTGTDNVFIGYQAGFTNTTQGENTFVGTIAGLNSNAIKNTFIGYAAGSSTNAGYRNTAVGYDAFRSNTTGTLNACFGDNACYNIVNSTNGSENTCLGTGACSSTNGLFTSASNNICVGFGACNQENNVNNNIEIGNSGPDLEGNGPNTIIIGQQGLQTAAYLAGITPGPPPGLPSVLVDGNGRLWQGSASGSGVMGNCLDPASGGTYLTRWVGPNLSNMVGCSFLFQQTGTNFIGIGNINPSKALDVTGEINARKWYDIGLPETPVLSIGTAVTFTNDNLFVGIGAGENNPANPGTGTDNVFSGFDAGFNATGTQNTFAGSGAGYGATSGSNNTGSNNTFSGYQSGYYNTSGSNNTFSGFQAGWENTTGTSNTFVGYIAGLATTTTSGNSFFGNWAGEFNVGSANTCVGDHACWNVEGGSNNTALGSQAGGDLHSSNSIFVGYQAGGNTLNQSDNDIYIGNLGNPVAAESNVMRIGTQGAGAGQQTDTYVAGIFMSAPGGAQRTVCVDVNGKLWGSAAGCGGSSRRFKDQIADMGDSSSKLFQLRPVTFFYKPQYDDGTQALQYGLIAEEVAKVYPEMVVYDKDGQPSGVKYQLLAPMLLSELQKEHTVVMAQQDELQTQLQQIKAQRHEIDGLKLQLQQQNASLQERLTKLESYVATQMKTASDNPPPMTATANGGVQ
jgi:hypothetical protein